MRATTPLDSLQFLGDPVEMPKPRYAVGTRLDLSGLSAEDFAYYAKKVVRQVLRRTRKILDTLYRQGYLQDMRGKRMLPGNKEQVRRTLSVMLQADSVEIAGMSPVGMHVVGAVSNQCYLRNGQCHSGASFEYHLLFRKVIDGNKAVYIHPEAIIGEASIKALLLREHAAAA